MMGKWASTRENASDWARAHNPKVVGSNPAPTTSLRRRPRSATWAFVVVAIGAVLRSARPVRAWVAACVVGLGVEDARLPAPCGHRVVGEALLDPVGAGS